MDKHANLAIREATGAFNRSILDAVLPPIRAAALFKGYAVAVHGSLKRDIDLVAVAWTEQACPVDDLVHTIKGAVAGVLGNCITLGDPTKKPHGRIAVTLITPAHLGEIDLSIIPPSAKPQGEE